MHGILLPQSQPEKKNEVLKFQGLKWYTPFFPIVWYKNMLIVSTAQLFCFLNTQWAHEICPFYANISLSDVIIL